MRNGVYSGTVVKGIEGNTLLALLSLIIVRAQLDCIPPSSSDPPLDSGSAVTSQQPATLSRITSSLLGTDRHHAEPLYTATTTLHQLPISKISFMRLPWCLSLLNVLL